MGTLERALAKIEDGGLFKLIVDHSGYDVAACNRGCDGMRALIEVCNRRKIRCVAVAHIHRDASKMEDVRRIGQLNERFFTDATKAESWIATVSE